MRREWPAWATWRSLVLGVVLFGAVGLAALPTEEERSCQAYRAKAAGEYAGCTQKAQAKWHLKGDDVALALSLGKCAKKYASRWPKLQLKYQGTQASCDRPRLEDNGDGTVTDQLTGLQWEQKRNDGTVHDRLDRYAWGIYPPPPGADPDAANGAAFTTFLQGLWFSANNSPECFAGQCDWRLPTRDELLTIAWPPYPGCTTPPCIDQVFNPGLGSFAGTFLSSSTVESSLYVIAPLWNVQFLDGRPIALARESDSNVRAVRGGM